jgi:hypothetical protein
MLTNVARRLTAAEVAREPRMLHVVAWFDGHAQSQGGRPSPMPRRLTTDEAAAWREGWNDGWREKTCHDAHGFVPCTQEAHDLNDRDAYLAGHIADELAAHRSKEPR